MIEGFKEQSNNEEKEIFSLDINLKKMRDKYLQKKLTNNKNLPELGRAMLKTEKKSGKDVKRSAKYQRA